MNFEVAIDQEAYEYACRKAGTSDTRELAAYLGIPKKAARCLDRGRLIGLVPARRVAGCIGASLGLIINAVNVYGDLYMLEPDMSAKPGEYALTRYQHQGVMPERIAAGSKPELRKRLMEILGEQYA